MQKSTRYFLGAFVLGLLVLAAGLWVYRSWPEFEMKVYRWAYLPVVVIQAWLLLRSARQVRIEQRVLPQRIMLPIAVMGLASLLSVGVWVLVLLVPLLKDSDESGF